MNMAVPASGKKSSLVCNFLAARSVEVVAWFVLIPSTGKVQLFKIV